jgi:hypothetical protein
MRQGFVPSGEGCNLKKAEFDLSHQEAFMFDAKRWVAGVVVFGSVAAGQLKEAPQTVWIEAESLGPLHGANFSYQPVEQTTKGSWSIAGPGVAPEWTQGGESEFMSIGARADEAADVTAGKDVEVPVAGTYTLWVRYADYRKKEEKFGVRVTQGGKAAEFVFGVKPIIDDLDPLSLIWDWSFGWDSVKVPLEKGAARIEVYTTGPTDARRQIDCLCLTTDENYKPTGRQKPDAPAWAVLRALRENAATVAPPTVKGALPEVPAAWRISEGPPAFVWNTGKPWLDELTKPDKAGAVEWPFGVDGPLTKDFLEMFRGKSPPVYSSALSGAAWHVPMYPEVFAAGSPFLAYLDRHKEARFAVLLNYGDPNWPKDADPKLVYENLMKRRDRFVGYISGENIGYAEYDPKAMNERVKAAKTRGEVFAALKEMNTDAVVKKFSAYAGKPLTAAEAWGPVISCLSANNEAFAHMLSNLGEVRTGHENSGNAPTLARRVAFLRGAARQFGHKFADYQSANLGDSATMFSREAFFFPASSRYILDNSYDAWAGAGVNWLLKDYMVFYTGGVDVFYNEQGTDIFWKPGGNSAGDGFPVQLSPKGKVAEAVIKLATDHPRGTQFTPIAFLLDEAHGWAQERYSPGAFGMDPLINPAVLTPGVHEASIRGWFDVAYFPAPLTQNENSSAIRQTYVSGVFGDIFDVIVGSAGHAQIAATYKAIVLAGEVPLSEDWGAALKAFMENGGTLVVCADQVSGPGAAALALPKGAEAAEASQLEWKPTGEKVASNVFRFKSPATEGATVLATAGEKAVAVSLPRGTGKLIVIGVPLGLGVDQRPVPVVSWVMREVTRGVMPLRVDGDVEWMVNKLPDGGWTVTVMNNRGVIKPQHGVNPTEHGEAQAVRIVARFRVQKSEEWMTGTPVEWKAIDGGAAAAIAVPAGAVRVVAVYPGQ